MSGIRLLVRGNFDEETTAHFTNWKAILARDAGIGLSINEWHYNHNYFQEHKIPENVTATADTRTALFGADYNLRAVPVQVFPPCGPLFELLVRMSIVAVNSTIAAPAVLEFAFNGLVSSRELKMNQICLLARAGWCE